MAEVLTQSQFQVLTHQQTGVQTGRIYFPAVFSSQKLQYTVEYEVYID